MHQTPAPRFIDYYNLESYLFDVVNPRFHSDKFLSAFDFFCIVIWKANRAKSRIAKRLRLDETRSLESAVREMTNEIATASSAKARVDVLMGKWAFRLPMASAILTVLYPNEFTVYDVRVCSELNAFESLSNISDTEHRWTQYQAYRDAVENEVKQPLSLRDKDRWLWGRSFVRQLENDIASGFTPLPSAKSDA